MPPSSSVERYAQVTGLTPVIQETGAGSRKRDAIVMSGNTFVLMANAGSQHGFLLRIFVAKATDAEVRINTRAFSVPIESERSSSLLF
jgi:hypothetical protein